MLGVRRAAVAFTFVAVLAVATATPAFAIFPSLSTTLTGPAIGGVTPGGAAKVDQSKLPAQPGTLDARVQNVNLPDGTVLAVVITDCGSAPVGSITLNRGGGQLRTALPQFCQVGRNSAILLTSGGTTILSGGATWKV